MGQVVDVVCVFHASGLAGTVCRSPFVITGEHR